MIEDFVDEGRSIIYYMIKTPIGISNRDFLQQRKVKFDFPKKGMITMHFKSVENDKMPPKPKVVRAETIISGYIFEEENVPGKGVVTKLTIISLNDIKGIVPKSIVNMVSGKAPKQWVNNFSKACTDFLKGNFKK